MLDADMKASLSIATFAMGAALMGVVTARMRQRIAMAACATICLGAGAAAIALASASSTPLPRPPSPDAFARRIVRAEHAYDEWSGRNAPAHRKQEEERDVGPPEGALGVSAMHDIEPAQAGSHEDESGNPPEYEDRRFRRRNAPEQGYQNRE